jgi:hypothetical protein
MISGFRIQASERWAMGQEFLCEGPFATLVELLLVAEAERGAVSGAAI